MEIQGAINRIRRAVKKLKVKLARGFYLVVPENGVWVSYKNPHLQTQCSHCAIAALAIGRPARTKDGYNYEQMFLDTGLTLAQGYSFEAGFEGWEWDYKLDRKWYDAGAQVYEEFCGKDTEGA